VCDACVCYTSHLPTPHSHTLRVTITDAKQSQKQAFDVAVGKGCAVYSKRMHNLVADNCHSHTANCLMHMGYDGWTTQVGVCVCVCV
jgi:hypothetical protein